MGSIRRSITILAAAATVAGTLSLARPAAAAEPTRVQDISTAVKVVAVDGNRKLEVTLERSENAGAFAYARLHGGPAGDSLAEGEGWSSQHLSIVEVWMGRPAGWMKSLTGRSAMKSPGAPSLRRVSEREFWRLVRARVNTGRGSRNVSVRLVGSLRWLIVRRSGAPGRQPGGCSHDRTGSGS